MSDRLRNFDVGAELATEFFRGRCDELAEALLGKLLVTEDGDEMTGGIVVETEAYLGENDPACHLSDGRTKRNRAFFNGAGTVYVFKIYDSNNLNVITEYESHPECILVRALRPTHGVERMKLRRGVEETTELASGPGRLTEALGIEKRELNDVPLDECRLSIYDTDLAGFEVVQDRRIGVTEAEDWLFRFCIGEDRWVSKPPTRGLEQSLDADRYYRDLISYRITSLSEYR